MREGLPSDHGLDAVVVEDARLVPRHDGKAFLTDVQSAAIRSGVGRGESLLVVSPTSTGKTLIGIWAMAMALRGGCRTAYLVTHRALANQKFDDLKALFLKDHLQGVGADIVLATGDEVVDGDGENPAAPLEASIVVATYEKYLGLLSSGGLPTNLSEVVVVCDEIQLISDPTRGPAVEILLTLLRQAKCRQLLGLSAVLARRDAETLAGWLEAKLVFETAREKRLVYQCRTPSGVLIADTDSQRIERSTRVITTDTLEIIDELRNEKRRLPIIVFCMTKAQTYQLAEGFERRIRRGGIFQTIVDAILGGPPETNVEGLLARYVPQRFAVHNADMTDEERRIVEAGLAEGRVDVVFATSTLAAGVNFPLSTAVFHSWVRWDQATRTRHPIEPGEFHNMAGRAGRMGLTDGDGLVIYCAENVRAARNAEMYLDFSRLSELTPRITPAQFDSILLNLISSGLGNTEEELFALLTGTLSAARERDTNVSGLRTWEVAFPPALRRLSDYGLIGAI
jgi:helicase